MNVWVTAGKRGVALRLLAAPGLGVLGPLLLWPLPVAYLVLPVLAALHLRRTGARAYLADDAPRIVAGLGWLVSLHAWAALLEDRFPAGREAEDALTVRPSGRPTVASALLRLVAGAPGAAAVLAVGAAALLPWLAAAAVVALGRQPPAALAALPAAAVRRSADFLVRHASLVGHREPGGFLRPGPPRRAAQEAGS